MGKIVAISGLVVLLSISGADADIVELPLGAEGRYDVNSGPWEMNFDLGVTFIEITNVYIDWSGEMTAALAILYDGGGSAVPLDVGIYASLGSNPYFRSARIWGGEETYPNTELFDCRSEFERIGGSSWSDLLDGQGTITIDYMEWIILNGTYVEYGSVTLDRATLIVEGTPVPEPATLLLLGVGGLALLRRRRA